MKLMYFETYIWNCSSLSLITYGSINRAWYNGKYKVHFTLQRRTNFVKIKIYFDVLKERLSIERLSKGWMMFSSITLHKILIAEAIIIKRSRWENLMLCKMDIFFFRYLSMKSVSLIELLVAPDTYSLWLLWIWNRHCVILKSIWRSL